MTLRHIYLALDLNDKDLESRSSDFQFRTRALCNFVERKLRPLKFVTPDFSKICIFGSRTPWAKAHIEPVSALVTRVAYEEGAEETLTGHQLQEFYIDMLIRGLVQCRNAWSIPYNEILSSVEEFRAAGYQNRWLFKSRTLKSSKLKAELWCELTMQAFQLTLAVTQRGHEISRENVLTTKPDEIIFHHRFKDLVVEDSRLKVIDRFNKSVYSVSLTELVQL